jgi:hypothetical protein
MRRIRILLGTLGLALAVAAAGAGPAPLILISLDGFRQDYLETHATLSPTLQALRRDGVSARGLIPVFPSNTFPNHYTLVTGLRPARHGIINNTFLDPESGEMFQSNLRQCAINPRWWGGEPIWITAVTQGRKAATSFWVGSEAEIKGARPTYWQHFDYSVPFSKRLEELVGWLRRPAEERPAVIAFYLEEANGAGHRFGPDSAELAAAVQLLDGRLAALTERLRTENLEANLLVVSDHGMAATSRERVVLLDEYLGEKTVPIEADGSVLALRPPPAEVDEVVRQLGRAPHVRVYRAEQLPERFGLTGNPRIAPVWVLPEEGWHILTRSAHDRLRQRYPVNGYLQGDHGYDPASPRMHGILIAHGPAFRRGVSLPAVENLHVYALMCAVLGLTPAANDGDDRLAKAALRD